VSGADGLVKGGAAGVSAVLVFGDFTALEGLPSKGVVLGKLRGLADSVDLAVAIEAGVADVGEVKLLWGKPGEGEGGAHAFGVFFVASGAVNGAVDGGNGFFELGGVVRGVALGDEVHGLGGKASHDSASEFGGEVAGVSTSHAVGDAEDEVAVLEGALPVFVDAFAVIGAFVGGCFEDEPGIVIGIGFGAVGAIGFPS